MIDYGLFRFACPPHTGASWFIKAAQLAGLGPGFEYKAHTNFSPSFNKNGASLKVSLVRHPYNWLMECYTGLRDGCNFNSELGLISHLNYSSFFDFILNFLLLEEDTIGQIYAKYEADTIMRIEDQPWALIELLESLGIPQQLRGTTNLVAKPNAPLKLPEWFTTKRKQVMKRERKLCEKYDYY